MKIFVILTAMAIGVYSITQNFPKKEKLNILSSLHYREKVQSFYSEKNAKNLNKPKRNLSSVSFISQEELNDVLLDIKSAEKNSLTFLKKFQTIVKRQNKENKDSNCWGLILELFGVLNNSRWAQEIELNNFLASRCHRVKNAKNGSTVVRIPEEHTYLVLDNQKILEKEGLSDSEPYRYRPNTSFINFASNHISVSNKKYLDVYQKIETDFCFKCKKRKSEYYHCSMDVKKESSFTKLKSSLDEIKKWNVVSSSLDLRHKRVLASFVELIKGSNFEKFSRNMLRDILTTLSLRGSLRKEPYLANNLVKSFINYSVISNLDYLILLDLNMEQKLIKTVISKNWNKLSIEAKEKFFRSPEDFNLKKDIFYKFLHNKKVEYKETLLLSLLLSLQEKKDYPSRIERPGPINHFRASTFYFDILLNLKKMKIENYPTARFYEFVYLVFHMKTYKEDLSFLNEKINQLKVKKNIVKDIEPSYEQLIDPAIKFLQRNKEYLHSQYKIFKTH